MILFSLLLACGPDAASNGLDQVASPSGAITADAVLQRHLDASHQCDLMVADSYLLEWETVVTDKKTSAKAEAVIQQGRQGLSFVRMHQQTKPAPRFTAFGLSPNKTWWSAGDLGVKTNLPESVANSLMVYLDPTPVCSFQARWKERKYIGEEDFQGQRVHHVQGIWSDDTAIDLWFDVSTGLLAGTRTEMGDLNNTLVMKDYQTHDGVKWPGEVISSRIESSLRIFVAEKLKRLELNKPTFRDIGPNEVAALLASDNEKRQKAKK